MSTTFYISAWGLLTLLIGSSLAAALLTEDGSWKRAYLPGETTHGHYQIELKCSACHDPESGVTSKSCLKCHEQELEDANDTHPASKFNDPTNAARLSVLDAQNCITCHKEHVPHVTHSMGVSLPDDFCFHCHQEIAEDRPSHQGMAFNTCQTSGCHNYHDNRALNENFLRKHLEAAEVPETQTVPARNGLERYLAKQKQQIIPLTAAEAHYPTNIEASDELIADWAGSAHAKVGLNCSACHTQNNDMATWQNAVSHNTCNGCHENETAGFLQGMHGMRLAQGLSPMSPAMARLPMNPNSLHAELSCSSCHGPHDADVRAAAVESCLKCHNDEHSLAYTQSPHAQLWQDELAGKLPEGSGVSCATCHLPREVHGSRKSPQTRVQHNQNDNLRPNEKMVRGVCLSCHDLQFSLDAMHDAAEIQTNFSSSPDHSVESLEMVRKWFESRGNQN